MIKIPDKINTGLNELPEHSHEVKEIANEDKPINIIANSLIDIKFYLECQRERQKENNKILDRIETYIVSLEVSLRENRHITSESLVEELKTDDENFNFSNIKNTVLRKTRRANAIINRMINRRNQERIGK